MLKDISGYQMALDFQTSFQMYVGILLSLVVPFGINGSFGLIIHPAIILLFVVLSSCYILKP
jgi:hypothetical protein